MVTSISRINVDLLKEHLAQVSEHEAELTDHLYERLFAKRPDAEALFGTSH
jgi:hemoglobin-like flavoprotein